MKKHIVSATKSRQFINDYLDGLPLEIVNPESPEWVKKYYDNILELFELLKIKEKK